MPGLALPGKQEGMSLLIIGVSSDAATRGRPLAGLCIEQQGFRYALWTAVEAALTARVLICLAIAVSVLVRTSFHA